MGGLLARLPWSGGALVFAAAALAALPPLNGFFSEWLLYLALVQAGAAPAAISLAAYLGLAALAVVGGLAAVVFTRLVGTALLGSPRSAEAARAHEGSLLLRAPLLALGAGCVGIALFPAGTVSLLAPAMAQVLRVPAEQVARALAPATGALAGPARVALAALVVLGAALALGSRRMLARRDVRRGPTWGCGFAGESARIQYTAASYAELALSAAVPKPLRPRATLTPPEGPFPKGARLALRADDPARTRLFEPAFQAIGERFAQLRRFQQTRLNLQLLYTVVTVLVLSALLLVYGPP
jgi:NADH:ubiquinone oxidoreductase subunit 5 (subunit L)/multisubunit Na+/H+ antiporter MnhA subunit